MKNPRDTSALFEESSSWEAYKSNPHIEERTRLVLGILPQEAACVADIGCGNGVLLRALAMDRRVIGIDPSQAALTHFDLPRIGARGEALPLRSGAVDLAICLEVLEHLTDDGVKACAAELDRIARRYLLIGTPDREDPLRNALKCPRCGTIFNRNHHLQTFDASRIEHLFPGFDTRLVLRCGQSIRPYPSALLRLRHGLAHRFFRGPGETRGLCPACGNQSFPPFRANLLSWILDATNALVSPRRPYWVMMLLERRSRGRIGV